MKSSKHLASAKSLVLFGLFLVGCGGSASALSDADATVLARAAGIVRGLGDGREAVRMFPGLLSRELARLELLKGGCGAAVQAFYDRAPDSREAAIPPALDACHVEGPTPAVLARIRAGDPSLLMRPDEVWPGGDVFTATNAPHFLSSPRNAPSLGMYVVLRTALERLRAAALVRGNRSAADWSTVATAVTTALESMAEEESAYETAHVAR